MSIAPRDSLNVFWELSYFGTMLARRRNMTPQLYYKNDDLLHLSTV